MNELLKTIKASIVVQLALSYVLIVSGLITNFFQLLTLITWPFNKHLYRKLNYYLNYVFYANYAFLTQWWSGSTCDIFVKKEDVKYFNKENIVVVMNHKYDIDWIMGIIVCQNINILAGTKAFFKYSLKYLPIFGWNWIFGENIFLKRNWEADSKNMIEKLNSIFDFPKDYHYTIIVFCEGTRYTKEKHEESLKFAKSRGLVEYKHHLLPRTRGFNLLMNLGKSKIDAIYDCTLVVKKECDSSSNIVKIKNGQPVKAQMLINRISIENVPIDDEKKCSEFLYKMYEGKDEVFDKFVKTGDLSSIGIEKLDIKRNKYDLYLTLMWIILILPISIIYLLKSLWFGSLYYKLAFLIIIFLTYLITKMLLKNSMVNTSSSSFGLSTQKTKQN